MTAPYGTAATAAPALGLATARGLRALGRDLRALGYTERPVARALGLLEWRSHDLDREWWLRPNYAEGRLGALVDLFIRGASLPARAAERALPRSAWDAGVLVQRRGDVWVDGIVLPLGEDLVWTDRADRSFREGGLFLPDSTSLALRRCLPPSMVDTHLDLGAGGGCVTIAAARRARRTVAMDLAPRSARAVQRTAALNGIDSVTAWTARADQAADAGLRFDRITFVLPLLVSWEGLAEEGPIHTISGQPGLLVQVVRLLPRLLADGGLALLYCQDWAEGRPLADAIGDALQGRAWRGVHWQDVGGDYRGQTLHTGVLALRLDRGRGFAVRANDAPDSDVQTWWPYLAPLLGE